MDDVLGKLFGSPARVKIMRLFLFNPQTVFETADIRQKSHVSSKTVGSELVRLRSIGLIKKKNGTKELTRKKGKKTAIKKKQISGWTLNAHFLYLHTLQNLLMSSKSFRRDVITKRFGVVGRIKLLIISGIFIQNEDSRVDVLLVGDYLRKHLITKVLRVLESEIGKELRCAILETKDFTYRLGVYDKFVRDVIDYPHEKLIDKIGLRR